MPNYNICTDVANSIFRTYDIRGVVDKTLTPDVVYTIGLAIGSEAQHRGQKKLTIGRDGRLSGPAFLEALAEGLMATGCDVINVGEVTTPMLYYAANIITTSGVMITGSHNPPGYNGIKTVIGGTTLCEGAIQDLYQRIKNQDFKQGTGHEEHADILDSYIERITSDIKLKRPLKVVIDCGNGVGGKVAPKLFRALGCEVIDLFCDVDGTFPNHHPDPQIAENLQDIIAAVKEHNADVGLGFDGDADRLGVVTDKGEIVWPDRQMILFCRDILPRHQGARIPFDVKCTQHLAKEITRLGGIPEMIRTGHALLKAKVWEFNSPVGGELSGHFFFKERWYGFDDGIYAGVRILEILAKDPRKSSEIFADIPNSFNTPELKMQIGDDKKFAFMEKFLQQAKSQFSDGTVNTIDGIRVDFKDGFGLVRPSNTTPTIIFRFEGETKEALDKIIKRFREQLMTVDNSLELPF